MKKRLIQLASCLLLTACTTQSPSMTENEKKLKWVEKSNAQQDAEMAIKKRDFRLWAFAQRSVVIPGIDAKNSSKYELKCGIRYMEGMTDVVSNDHHLKMMQSAHTYALQYNTVIKAHCKP